MTLRIARRTDQDGQGTILALIGRIRAEDIAEIRKEMETVAKLIALDLREITLVDREAVKFLGWCESLGVELVDCARYIRDWIARERWEPGEIEEEGQ